MKKYNVTIAVLAAVLFLLPCINAQYWFQSGARGGQSSQFNSGASVTIQTLVNTLPQQGSIAFWVGEDLQNGAFLQAGYVIENQSGKYPTSCDVDGCNQYEYISAGSPEWFYEYFPPGQSTAFLGRVGPNDSAGKNGTYHTYGFYSQESTWYFIMDGNTMGQINLGANTSGYNDVVAFGEVANASNSGTKVSPIKFLNLSIYRFGKYFPAPTGYSYIGYGVGSLMNLGNPYGVQELGSRANAFEVGSGLQEPRNDYPLWQSSFILNVESPYGNTSSSGLYIASRTVEINTPLYIYLNNSAREAFTGWQGNGIGSYTGKSNDTVVLMYSNITEVAKWQLQYLVNITSAYGNAHGSGWYPANSTAYYSLSKNITYQNNVTRFVFEGWQNGSDSQFGTVKVSGPVKINAMWQKEYLVNGSSQYGNITGTGWYGVGSLAHLSVSNRYKNESSTERLAFYQWSDGNKNASHDFTVGRPINLAASYKNQFLVNLYGVDIYGSRVNVSNFYIKNSSLGNTTYLFSGIPYLITGAIYDNSKVNFTQYISTNSSGPIAIKLPLYNVNFKAADVFGVPVSMPITITFSNGTSRNVQLNQSGLMVGDVAYGKATASTNYLGLSLSTSAQYGSTAKFTVVSVEDLSVFIGIVVLSIIMYVFVSRRILKVHVVAPAHNLHNQ